MFSSNKNSGIKKKLDYYFLNKEKNEEKKRIRLSKNMKNINSDVKYNSKDAQHNIMFYGYRKEVYASNKEERKKMSSLVTKLLDEHTKDEYKEEDEDDIIKKPIRTISKDELKKLNKKEVDISIETLDDLIYIANNVQIEETTLHSNFSNLCKIKNELQELKDMVGMKKLKEDIFNLIIYYLQDLHIDGDENHDYMHTVIYGPPGTGKTEVAKIIGKIFSQLHILKSDVFKKVTRADLVAGYLGQTALKTKEVIDSCLGGVLFIDEAYALGDREKRDSFAKECIDTLCEGLSNHKNNLMVIIAGYEKELNDCFFNYNEGLDSRFVWRFTTDDYTGEELYQILRLKVLHDRWTIMDAEESKIIEWFNEHKSDFTYYGRDIEVLWSKIKIIHSRNLLKKNKDYNKKKITILDITEGFNCFIENKRQKKKEEVKLIGMYI